MEGIPVESDIPESSVELESDVAELSVKIKTSLLPCELSSVFFTDASWAFFCPESLHEENNDKKQRKIIL
jgi:hypothetical protein